MPWARAKLRGQSVWARVNAVGEFLSEGGRVEVRYNPKDGRAYRAATRNLELLADALQPDDFCAPAAPESDAKPKNSASSKTVLRASVETPAVQEDVEYTAYTDGACSGNPGPAGCGMLIEGPGGKTREGYAYLGIATNNVAELTAVLLAVEGTPSDAKSILVLTDSKYAIGVLSLGWKAKANQELIARIRSVLALRGKTVRMKYVPGHAGVPGNERADELARTAILKRESLPLG